MKFTGKATVNPRIKLVRDLAKLDVGDMKRMLVPVDSSFSKNEGRLFSSEGASSGGRWPALSTAYAKYKRKVKPGRKIMTFSGKTRDAFKNRNHPNHVAGFTLRPRPRLEVGAKSKVAAYHKRPRPGAPNPLYNPRMPDRNVIRQSPRQMSHYFALMKDYLVKVKWNRVERALKSGGVW